MAITTAKSAFFKGARDSLPFVVIVVPFAALFGVLAREVGLSVAQTVGFSMIVYAGAAQFAALQLIEENVPVLLVLVSALAVNLRVAMYSASLTPYLGAAPLWQRALAAYGLVDQSYAISHGAFEAEPDMTLAQRISFFAGAALPLAPTWFLGTYLGAVTGAQLDADIPLDFALPCAFLAMLGPMKRTPAHVVAAFVASVVALLAVNLPYSLGLMAGGLAGMLAGAQAEVMLTRTTPDE